MLCLGLLLGALLEVRVRLEPGWEWIFDGRLRVTPAEGAPVENAVRVRIQVLARASDGGWELARLVSTGAPSFPQGADVALGPDRALRPPRQPPPRVVFSDRSPLGSQVAVVPFPPATLRPSTSTHEGTPFEREEGGGEERWLVDHEGVVQSYERLERSGGTRTLLKLRLTGRDRMLPQEVRSRLGQVEALRAMRAIESRADQANADLEALRKEAEEQFQKLQGSPFNAAGQTILMAFGAREHRREFERGVPEKAARFVGQPAPEIAGRDLEGEERSLAKLRGKPVLLFFWIQWCGNCRRELGGLEGIARRHPDLAILGLHQERGRDEAEGVARALERRPPLLLGADEAFARYDVSEYPTFVLVDRDGIVRARLAGSATQRLAEELEKLVGGR